MYRTKLSETVWKRFYPDPVVVKYHFQKALFKLSRGYSLRFIRAFPFILISASIFYETEFRPTSFRMALKAYSFLSLTLKFNIIMELMRKFLMTVGLPMAILSSCLEMAANPWLYFSLILYERTLVSSVIPLSSYSCSSYI